MNTELDSVKSTITISLGTKNRLRNLKGSRSYEDFINYLIRQHNAPAPGEENSIELQTFIRVKGIYSTGRFKILFSYTRYNNSPEHIFDIRVDTVREDGSQIPFDQFLEKQHAETHESLLKQEYDTYFALLIAAIRNDVEPAYKHKGRIEDHYSWEQEFKVLNISTRSLREDVIEKLENYRRGVRLSG